MKKIAILSVALLALIGCAKETDSKENNASTEKAGYMTFKVAFEDDLIDADTKATLDRSGVFEWDGGEVVYFSNADGSSKASGTYNASTKEITVEAGDWVTASYPNELTNGGKLSNLDGNGPAIVAKVNGTTLKFHHIGSIINVKFTSIPLNCDLIFEPGNDETWGDGAFAFDGNGVPSFSSGSTPISITKSVTTSDSGSDISISVPNLSYTNGFTIKLSAGGKVFYQKQTTTSRNLSSRPTLLNMKELTLPTYTVAGSKNGDDADDVIFGTAWDVLNTANDLVLDSDGYYKKSYSDVTENIKFKVVENHAWGTEWPGTGSSNNKEHNISDGADIIIKFNPVDGSIDINSSDVYVIAGDSETVFGSGWSPKNTSNRLESYNVTTLYKRYRGVPQGDLNYKLVKNYSSWQPSDNIYHNVLVANSDIIIAYYTDTDDYGWFESGKPYSVAGNSGLCGTEWDTSSNDLSWTSQDFILSKTFTGINAGTYEYKVVGNHAWGEAYPGSNKSVKVESNNSDVTILFNILTKEVSESVVAK